MSEATNLVATVRAATRADVPAIGRLGALLVRMHHDFDPERFIAPPPRTEDAYASFIGRQIGESSVVLLVAERDGEVLGYATPASRGPITCRCAGRRGSSTTSWSTPTIAGTASVGCCLKPYWRRSRRAARLGSWCRRRSRTKPHNGCSLARGFRRTMIEMTRELHGHAS